MKSIKDVSGKISQRSLAKERSSSWRKRSTLPNAPEIPLNLNIGRILVIAVDSIVFPPNLYVEVLTSGPQNVTINRDQAFKEVVKVKRGHVGTP